MIKSVTITNYLGEKLVLDLTGPEKSGLFITSIKGLGPSKASINTTEIASFDGTLFNSSRMSERNIVLSLRYYPENGESVEEIRHKTYKYFPSKKNLKFEVETDIRKTYCIGYVESNEPDIFNEKSGCSISILCPDPYFYSSGGESETTFSGVVPEFEFPFENDIEPVYLTVESLGVENGVMYYEDDDLIQRYIEMGRIENLQTQNIHYEGDVECGMTIIIHVLSSPGDISIYNLDTREKMVILSDRVQSLTGQGIKPGDTITINTNRGEKSIILLRDRADINILNALDRDSSWFQLKKGDNLFTYTTEQAVTSALQFKVLNEIRYEGV